jgi:hypothetical protein
MGANIWSLETRLMANLWIEEVIGAEFRGWSGAKTRCQAQKYTKILDQESQRRSKAVFLITFLLC